MTGPRTLVRTMAAFLLVGCASYKPATTPGPEAVGPDAMIHATYYGGMLNRQTEAVFKVDENAYVMVAHLGGDGRLTVLYPEDGRESGRVSGQKWFRTSQVAAYYDAAPQLYSFATMTYRMPGAQLDSYDGRGYGFVFLIASKFPLRFDKVSEYGLWDELVVRDYRQASDPRLFVRAFAAQVAGSHPYTLKFARSYSTFAATSYSDQLFDCAMLAQYGFSSFFSPWSFPSLYTSSLGFPGANAGCGSTRSAYAFFYRPVVFTTSNVPTTSTGPATAPPTPHPGSTLRPRRPGFDNPRSGMTFAQPMRNNSPEHPAQAPRDWRSLHLGVGGSSTGSGWGDSPRRRADGDHSRTASTGGSNASTGSSTAAAPMRAPDHRPVIERAAPAPAPAPASSSTTQSSKPKGDQH